MTDNNPSSIPYRNPEGYADPTAFHALMNIQSEQDADEIRMQRVIKTVKNMIDLAGFDILNRIELKSRDTGRIYR